MKSRANIAGGPSLSCRSAPRGASHRVSLNMPHFAVLAPGIVMMPCLKSAILPAKAVLFSAAHARV